MPNVLFFNGMNMPTIIVAARASPLSQVQVKEVYDEIIKYHPHVHFKPLLIETYGDQDLKTSLRYLDKSSDFFTREIDNALLQRRCNIAIHSAKDLPDPLKEGLTIAAITKGVDNGDVLVLNEGYTLDTLPQGAIIATSSMRREENVRSLRDDLRFVDVRGTIGHRLEQLHSGKVDGVVIAHAALIRLGLTHLNLISIPGPTADLQGQLAIVVRSDAPAMLKLFSCIDVRQLQLQ